MENKPKVFISYSYDSPDHIKWVTSLAEYLSREEIEVILDHWNCPYGKNLPKFMINGIKTADRVLVICTDVYIKKANNENKCGVVFEEMIITDEIYNQINTDKFIPIIRNVGHNSNKLPDFMGNRKYLDMSSEQMDQYNKVLKELVYELKNIPKKQLFGVNDISAEFKPFIPISTTATNLQKISFNNISCIISGAGKSTRMKIPSSKLLEMIEHKGRSQPMLIYSLDLFSNFGMPITLLYGFGGNKIEELHKSDKKVSQVKLIRVCEDDGNGLPKNTGGTLIAFSQQLLDNVPDGNHILFTVGDQPFMTENTIQKFIEYYLNNNLDACILTINAHGIDKLLSSTSTRISPSGEDDFDFITPPKDQPFNIKDYSPILDVGVLVIRKECFKNAVNKLSETEIFGKIIKFVPRRKNGHRHIKIYEELKNVDQFLNVNYRSGKVKSDIIEDWLKWNVLWDRNPLKFQISDYEDYYRPILEMDITLKCSKTPSCLESCTYKEYHSDEVINTTDALYALNVAWENGFRGILFSGGGENLEPSAYPVFIKILKEAKSIGFSTHLATNGLFFTSQNAVEILTKLNSIRFSINPLVPIKLASFTEPNFNRDIYSHLGIVGEKIWLASQSVAKHSLPTEIIANILLSERSSISEIESSILMLALLDVDLIRVKPRHVPFNNRWDVDPNAYTDHLEAIKKLVQRKELPLPKVVIPKLESLPKTLSINFPFTFCWYYDFNPLVIGCDSNRYACCEMKYNPDFLIGSISASSTSIQNWGISRHHPQRINKNKCFRGCKGYVINSLLEELLNEFKRVGNSLFTNPEYQIKRKALSEMISRTAPAN